jgi:glycosyltransferase involved in cell wall biosynthesis
VVDTHDVQFERLDRLFGGARASERRAELDQLRAYDRIIAITTRDHDTFARHLGEGAPPIDVIPMGLDLQLWDPAAVTPALPPVPRVSFYGTLSTGINQEAARHFLDTLVPELRRRRPGLEFWLLGAGAPPALEAQAAARGARLAGYQVDIRPHLASAGVLALSLRTGTGQRGRVVEAVALGVPVVGYHGALEGLEIGEEQGVFGVSTEAEFCERVLQLLDARDAWTARRPRIRQDLERAYGWEATYGRFPRLYRQLLERGSPLDGASPAVRSR